MPDDHSPELDQVRRLLFPRLPPGEGWARIDGAIAGARDERRQTAIERIAAGDDDLGADLVDALRRLTTAAARETDD